MCGIAGIIQLNNDSSCLSQIGEMSARVAHRGPDGEGAVTFGKVALGHRRLSIIELTEKGAQPMSDKHGMCHITYNGEIYNYLEVKEQLILKGFTFQSMSDTEVLLNAYLHWGESCVEHLNGMWSFAILDMSRKIVFCSRDRFGEKPFYYHRSSNAFYFASEIRQILPEMHDVVANKDLLERFLFGVSGEDFSNTFFKDIHKLPAGHNLVFDLSTNESHLTPYYRVEGSTLSVPSSFEAQREAFEELFFQSVRLRLRSDVQVGTCLSGGLDSSSIACVANSNLAQSSDSRFKAITAVSTDKSKDESEFARMVAESNRLDLHFTKPDYSQFRENIREVVRAQEEPFGTASIVMQFEVMRAAADNNIKVLLDGQGADELLLGYERYFSAYLQQLFHEGRFRHLWQQLKLIKQNNKFVSLATLVKYYFYFNNALIRKLKMQKKFRFMQTSRSVLDQIDEYARNSVKITELQKWELTQSNLPPLLRFEDKNAMWHSVETRLPFLDHRLVEFCLKLPIDSKIFNGWTKYILRKTMENRLPNEVVWRINKFGFEAPQSNWVEMHRSEMLHNVASSSLIETIFQSNEHLKEATQNPELLWKLYIISLWEDEFKVAAAV